MGFAHALRMMMNLGFEITIAHAVDSQKSLGCIWYYRQEASAGFSVDTPY
jgi:hypothetical protein